MDKKQFISIAKGIYPKYIKDARECVNVIFDTLVKVGQISPKELSEIFTLYGFSKDEFINDVVEKLEGKKK